MSYIFIILGVIVLGWGINNEIDFYAGRLATYAIIAGIAGIGIGLIHLIASV